MHESAFPLLSYTPFSFQHLIWASVFLAISSSHTDHVAQGHRQRGRGREANLAANTTRDFKGGSQHKRLPYITFLTLDVCRPLLWLCLNASLTASFRETPHRHIQIERRRQTDRHNPGLPPLPVINSLQEDAGWLAGRLWAYLFMLCGCDPLYLPTSI